MREWAPGPARSQKLAFRASSDKAQLAGRYAAWQHRGEAAKGFVLAKPFEQGAVNLCQDRAFDLDVSIAVEANFDFGDARPSGI